MTVLFLVVCVGVITVISILTFKREKKFDEENPASDYLDGRMQIMEKQDDLDIIIENELKYIAKNSLSNMVFDDYCKFEDSVGEAMDNHCPESLKYIDTVMYGKTPELGRMRNFIRYQADNLIVCGVNLKEEQ